MKINKILAAGIAATLAVTSLAAVASAEVTTKTFDMKQTKGKINLKSTSGLEVSFNADPDTGEANENINTFDEDANGSLLVLDANHFTCEPQTVTLKVTGIKGSKSTASKEYSFKFTNYSKDALVADTDDAGEETGTYTFVGDANQTYNTSGRYWGLQIYNTEGPADALVLGQFFEITKVAIEVEAKIDGITNATTYAAWGSTRWGDTYGDYNTAFIKGITAVNSWGNVKELVDLAEAADGSFMKVLADQISANSYFNYVEKSTSDEYAFLAMTTDAAGQEIRRYDVNLLSDTRAHNSINGGANGAGADYDQNIDDYNAEQFAGLASQTADFFNHSNNGQIVFTFTKGAGSTSWTGGIPSTEVGLKSLESAGLALFVNYNTSTGSLQSNGVVDKDKMTVTFDLADILKKMGGQTMGVISDIYYGLNQGEDYSEVDYIKNLAQTRGYLVEKVELLKDDSVVDAATDNSGDTVDVVVTPDNGTTDVVTVPDDGATAVIDITEPDDTQNNGATEIVTPTPTTTHDDDGNPSTGVGLAVIPALVAGAAMLVSKKRK